MKKKISEIVDKTKYYYHDVHSVPLPFPVIKILVILQTLVRDVVSNDLLKHASAMAYITIGSLVPSLAALFGLLSIFAPIAGESNELLSKLQTFILENLAQGTGDQVIGLIDGFLKKLDIAKIGITGFAGFLVTLIFLLRQIEGALNKIWLVRKERSMVLRFVYFWTFITLGGFFISLAVGYAANFNLSSFIPFKETAAIVVQENIFTEYLVKTIMIFCFLFLVYKFVPNCKVSIFEAAIGASVASILFQIAVIIFAVYVSFSKKEAIYGALAALPVFLMWLYICWVIILFGSVVSWRVQQGFSFEKKEETKEKYLTPSERLHSLRIRSVIPFFVLTCIYRKFLLADGKGLCGGDARKQLGLPSSWIIEALELLENLGYIAPVIDVKNELVGDYMTREFLPKFPPQTLSIERIRQELLPSITMDIEKWQKNIPKEFVNTLSHIVRVEDHLTTKVSFFEIIKGS